MREELKFIRQALHEKSTIPFEVPMAFIIPRTPSSTTMSDGDGGGNYNNSGGGDSDGGGAQTTIN